MVQRVCLVSSGTGGHLLPALTLARALRDSGEEPILVTEGRDAERVLLRDCPCRAESMPFRGGRLGMPLRLMQATLRARKFLRREKVDVVVGAGGSTTVPMALAARSLRLPVVLLEQNAVTGKANRLLAPLAHCTYLGLPSQHPPRRSVVTGTPVRPELGCIDRVQARQRLELDLHVPVVFVTGGSQGARPLNEQIPEGLCLIEQPVQVLHLCGSDNVDEVRARYRAGARHGTVARVESHVLDMATYYAAADLVICRGGGSTVAELAVAGRASIIVPYPHHKDRQQFHNGMVLEEVGAAVVVEQEGLSPEAVASLVGNLFRLDHLARMEDRARSVARNDSCVRILEDLKKLAARN